MSGWLGVHSKLPVLETPAAIEVSVPDGLTRSMSAVLTLVDVQRIVKLWPPIIFSFPLGLTTCRVAWGLGVGGGGMVGVGGGVGVGVTPTYTGIAPIAVWPFTSYALTQMSARPRMVEDGSNVASFSSWLG